jgi:hypothetical protein
MNPELETRCLTCGHATTLPKKGESAYAYEYKGPCGWCGHHQLRVVRK